MQRYLLTRSAQLILVIFLALSVVFFLLFLSGDPVKLFLPMDATFEQIEAMRDRMGFNDPLVVQYGRFIVRAVQGDFGDSLRHHGSALSLVLGRLPATAQLAGLSIVLSLSVAIPVGVLSAARRNSLFDQISIVMTVLGQAIPGFWLGIMSILLFSVVLGWLPTGGRGGWEHFVLPCLTLSAFTTARFARLTRSTVLDVLGADYIRTARAKGLSERVILYKHALRNASLSIITVLGLQLGQLLGGAVITETIFFWPGIGRFVVQALLNRDFPIVLAGVFLSAVTYATLNMLVDIAYAVVNPRIRFQ